MNMQVNIESDENLITMNLEEAIRQRRSVHYFKPGGQISQSQWDKLFELTALSPSSFNFQPWEFVIVDRDEDREKLHPLCWNQQQVLDCSAVIAVLGDKDPHRRDEMVLQQFEDNGYFDTETRKAFLAAVDVVYPDEGRKIEHAVGGACLAAMTLMLAAHGMGLATAPLIGFDEPAVRKFFNVPEDYMITMLIAIGDSADKELPRQQRRSMDDIVHWGEFKV